MSVKLSRRLRTALVVVLIVAILAVIAKLVTSLAYHRSTSELLRRNIHAALQAELEAVRAEGLPSTFTELDKWYVTPPADENAATILQEAFTLYTKPTPSPRRSRGRQEEERRLSLLPLAGFAELPSECEPLPDDMKAAIVEFLTQNEAAIKLLHKGASMKACRFPVDLTKGFGVQLPHLNKFREGANLLSLEVLLRTENGEPELAVESAISSFRLAESLVNEPLVISQLVRFNCQIIAAENLGRVLTRVTLTDEQLARLDSALTQAENMEGLTRAYVNDRCRVIFGYEHAHKEMATPVQLWPTLTELRQQGWREARYFHAVQTEERRRATSGLFELEVLTSLELRTASIRASQRPFPEQVSLAKKIVSQEMGITTFLMMPASTGAMLKQAKCVALLRTARAALAIERYRLANARLPDTLPDSAPLDPFTGQPLRYKKLAKGYVVYSVGDEKKDITFTVER